MCLICPCWHHSIHKGARGTNLHSIFGSVVAVMPINADGWGCEQWLVGVAGGGVLADTSRGAAAGGAGARIGGAL